MLCLLFTANLRRLLQRQSFPKWLFFWKGTTVTEMLQKYWEKKDDLHRMCQCKGHLSMHSIRKTELCSTNRWQETYGTGSNRWHYHQYELWRHFVATGLSRPSQTHKLLKRLSNYPKDYTAFLSALYLWMHFWLKKLTVSFVQCQMFKWIPLYWVYLEYCKYLFQ